MAGLARRLTTTSSILVVATIAIVSAECAGSNHLDFSYEKRRTIHVEFEGQLSVGRSENYGLEQRVDSPLQWRLHMGQAVLDVPVKITGAHAANSTLSLYLAHEDDNIYTSRDYSVQISEINSIYSIKLLDLVLSTPSKFSTPPFDIDEDVFDKLYGCLKSPRYFRYQDAISIRREKVLLFGQFLHKDAKPDCGKYCFKLKVSTNASLLIETLNISIQSGAGYWQEKALCKRTKQHEMCVVEREIY